MPCRITRSVPLGEEWSHHRRMCRPQEHLAMRSSACGGVVGSSTACIARRESTSPIPSAIGHPDKANLRSTTRDGVGRCWAVGRKHKHNIPAGVTSAPPGSPPPLSARPRSPGTSAAVRAPPAKTRHRRHRPVSHKGGARRPSTYADDDDAVNGGDGVALHRTTHTSCSQSGEVMCVCVCVCGCRLAHTAHPHTHTHTQKSAKQSRQSVALSPRGNGSRGARASWSYETTGEQRAERQRRRRLPTLGWERGRG